MSLTKRLIQKGKEVSECVVKTVVLSDFIVAQVDFLKMDIEESEFIILDELRRNKKLSFIKELVCEYHYNPINKKNSLFGILEILQGNSFRCKFSGCNSSPSIFLDIEPRNFLIYGSR